MNSTSRTVGLSRTRSLIGLALAIPLAGLVIGIAACLPVPVGDPENSTMDPAFTGAWLQEKGKGGALYLVYPYDRRTYLVRYFAYTTEDDVIKPAFAEETEQFKAWLTPIGDQRFVTLEPLTVAKALGIKENRSENVIRYFICRVTLSDNELTLRPIDPESELVQEIETREDAERVIREHVDDEELYMGEDEVTLKKLDPGNVDHIRAVLRAFHTE